MYLAEYKQPLQCTLGTRVPSLRKDTEVLGGAFCQLISEPDEPEYRSITTHI